jgi:hypothetical protein
VRLEHAIGYACKKGDKREERNVANNPVGLVHVRKNSFFRMDFFVERQNNVENEKIEKI